LKSPFFKHIGEDPSTSIHHFDETSSSTKAFSLKVCPITSLGSNQYQELFNRFHFIFQFCVKLKERQRITPLPFPWFVLMDN